MAFQELMTDIEVVKELIKLIIFIIITSISGRATLYVFGKKIDKREKKEYINFFRNNTILDKVFSKIEKTNRLKIDSLFSFDAGLFIGLFYFIGVNLLIFMFLAYASKSNMSFQSIAFFNMDPSIEINAISIYGIYYSMSLLFTLIIFTFYLFRVKNKTPKFNEFENLSMGTLIIFHSFSFFIGVTFIINYFTYGLIDLLFAKHISAPNTYNIQDYINNIPDNFLLTVVIFLIFFTFSFIFIIGLLNNANIFLKNINDKIIELYAKDFPFVCIKTTSGVTQGYIVNVFNKHLIVLRDKEIQKSISWNCIEFIEMENPLKNSNITEADHTL